MLLSSSQCSLGHYAQISNHPIIPDHKNQEAAGAVSWEHLLKNLSFLLLQNVVRDDIFIMFFGDF